LFLAGTVHICTILLVPAMASSDGWSRLSAFAGESRFTEVPLAGGAGPTVVGLDPLFVNGACRVDLSESPAAITVEARDRFWSLALYDPKGTIIFSLNDRTAVEGRLDMVVVNPAQNAELRKAGAPDLQQSIVVEGPSNELIAILRLFAPTAGAQAEARGIIAQAECLAEPLAVAAGPSG
jgi:uncharacterized membrane protein